ncbi:hypothetical protein HCAG_06683 [Histoplasma mississippiense (nom. inval.)]|uniref:hypothetical protein n=1 Tax=Ajellomyces capsulatus (strain NAm1 / WU24) TaxID=2059318 RepID=UPI000157CA52|nr:hypothetical protein HCAG_06683 [Histoplasma mississippiense (nom. inval.)]EDN09516.1 hypothetical protein HCAG_06683 [Histoplasma mississippiense (nom. inval.)]
MPAKQKVCLAYSGGLDTSCILTWLIEQGYDVVCFLADVGQAEDFKEAERKALSIGALKLVVADLKREFVEELCYRAIQCNAIWEDRYLLGLHRKGVRTIAPLTSCLNENSLSNSNDQVRFELAFYAIQPSIQVIAPWRLPEFYNRFAGRNDLLNYAEQHNIPVTSTKTKPCFAHCSYEAGILEDADVTPPDDMWKLTDDPRNAPDATEDFTLAFEKGIPSLLTLGGKKISDSVEIFTALNELGRKHGIGRIDIVENRYIGLKSEFIPKLTKPHSDSPAMTILRLAHLDLEGLVLDREVRLLRDQFVTVTWSKLLYNGLYFSPEREFIEKSILASQDDVNGQVRLRCYKGLTSVLGRSSQTSKLYSPEQSSMDSLDDFQPTDTTGFIATQAIRLKAYGHAQADKGVDLSQG